MSSKSISLCLHILVIALSIQTPRAQERETVQLIPKIHPLALIAIPRPTVLASVDVKYKKLALDSAFGQQWSFFMSSDPDTQRVKNFGNRYKGDLKFYLRP